MIYVQIKNSVIMNAIVIDDESLVPMFNINYFTKEPYDAVICVDDIDPQPGIGWLYDGTNFTDPSAEI